ncbi:hypothetical protein AQUCO_03800211v1 [Aquilegia coerulea]|uniref:Pentacotripeptide-repeat region of PRORP domain-containing protein n=1 Tax=Aquilegia coerulea TaxID=218851 RepID=A0A2G5CT95_AQUCA|nr:hypothetical protein AQUCO_03800211v1 [Aquilegia coerulea]
MKRVQRLVKPVILNPQTNFPITFPANIDYISRPNSITLSSALQHYIQSNTPYHGQKIHTHIIKIGYQPNTNVSIKLLILYLRSNCLVYARRMFDQMSQPTVSSYNSMIAGYLKDGQIEESLGLIQKLVLSNKKPDGFTLSIMLKLSTGKILISKDFGKQVHCQIFKANVEGDDILFTALVDSYVKNGKVSYARKVFDMMLERNVQCSTAMISGYMNQGYFGNAEEIFRKTIDKDVVVFNAMIEGYSKSIETAKRSLEVYIEMQRLDFRPTISTFVSVIGACSVMSAFEVGHQVQSQLVKTPFFTDVRLGSALVDMYSKCGRVEDARGIFDHMHNKNVFSWTSMIDGYGKNGNPNEALYLFDKMRRENRVEPNHVTFLGALSACGHAGLVSEGWEVFKSMEKDHMLKPRMEHYACMVDLLGRSGSLNEALEFIKGMSEKPNSDVWAALLGASRLHDDAEMAAVAANEIFKLDTAECPGAYVALSNTLAATGKWDGVTGVRELMKERGVSKDTGYSWVGTDSGLCGFPVG